MYPENSSSVNSCWNTAQIKGSTVMWHAAHSTAGLCVMGLECQAWDFDCSLSCTEAPLNIPTRGGNISARYDKTRHDLFAYAQLQAMTSDNNRLLDQSKQEETRTETKQ
jgi:hypothetical protein